jgi:hypothetical protein
MTPKEKAKELTNKYFKGSDLLYHDLSWIQAKECALIAVNEIIDCTKNGLGLTKYSKEYWEQVKKEIELL